MSKKEKFEKAIEWLEGASYNCENIEKLGTISLVKIVKDQIDNAIQYLNDEEVGEDVFGK